MVTEETLLDDGEFLLLLVEPSDRPDADEAPIKEFAQISDRHWCAGRASVVGFPGSISQTCLHTQSQGSPSNGKHKHKHHRLAERALWWKSAAGSTSEMTRRINIRAAMWPA